ncbi:MAG: hypothetical protein SFZ02_15470 [bacterium]|nr:hypothetical protein [bacterium]
MRRISEKSNWGHILLLLVLPIVLALINPNWLFNVGAIRDDYIYWGYQNDLLKYVGWNPSADHYFIERVSWLVPTYLVRQLVSPLMANFIVHLGVYYLAIFSVYGTLNRLFHARVALFIGLLMGGYSLVLRASGWDYLDGYAMALTALCVLLLTYGATTTRHNKAYLFGAGAVAMLIINAQFFHLFYMPALGIYYLLLNHAHARHHIVPSIIWGVLGVGGVFIILTLLYYGITGRWFIFANTLRVSQDAVSPQGWRGFINNHRAGQGANYHLLFGAVALMGIGIALSTKRFLPRASTSPLVALFGLSWAVLAGWAVLGSYGYLRLPFYNSNTTFSAFLVIGVMVAYRLTALSSIQFSRLIVAQIGVTVGLFALFSFGMADITTTWVIVITVFSGGLLALMWIIPQPITLIGLVIAVAILSFVGDRGTITGMVYQPDRLLLQRNYELIAQANQTIRHRYPNYGTDQFYFWFEDTIAPLDQTDKFFTGLLSTYFFRFITPFSLTAPIWDETLLLPHEIIVIAPPDRADMLLGAMQAWVYTNNYDMTIEHTALLGDADAPVMGLYFTQITPLQLIQDNRLRYEFASIPNRLQMDNFADGEMVNGRTFSWTSEPTARMSFTLADEQFDPTKTYQIQFLTLTPLEAEVLDSLKVSINGQELTLERIPQGTDTLWYAEIAGTIFNRDVLELVFETDRISRPSDFGYPDPRTLGVALDWLTIKPIEE